MCCSIGSTAAAAIFIRASLHRYSAFAVSFNGSLKFADMMIGAALFNVRQTGLDKQQAVQEKLSELAVYREGINAHLTAAIALAERSPGGLLMPNQSLLYAGRVLACSELHHKMHIARELCGGQICVTPDATSFASPETKPWLDKYYSVNDNWISEDRRKLLAFARDLLNSDLRRPPPDLPALRPGAPLRASRGRLPQFRLGRPAGFRQEVGRPVGSRVERHGASPRRQRGPDLVRGAAEGGRVNPAVVGRTTTP